MSIAESPPIDAPVLLWGIPELARALAVSDKTIRRMDAAGKLPTPIRVGRLLRWRVDEIERWVLARCPPRDEWDG